MERIRLRTGRRGDEEEDSNDSNDSNDTYYDSQEEEDGYGTERGEDMTFFGLEGDSQDEVDDSNSDDYVSSDEEEEKKEKQETD